jgi:hypothetical protein
MVEQSTMRVQMEFGQSGNGILKVKKSTMRIQMDIGQSMNTILKAIKSYFEDSDGVIIDKRPKPCEGKIVEVDGVKYKLVKV